MKTASHLAKAPASLYTLPIDVRMQIFSYLIPEHEVFYLGFSDVPAESKDMDEEGDRRPHPKTGTRPSVSGGLDITRVCRTFDQEYTSSFYQQSAFVIQNTTESFGAGMLFLINLRPSTASYLTDFFVYHDFWNVIRPTQDTLDTIVKESIRFKLARAAFCTAASAMSLQNLHVFVFGGDLNTKQYASLEASWLKPFLTIKGVGHFEMIFFNQEHKEDRALFCRFLDDLNASGVIAEAQAYEYYYPRLTDKWIASTTRCAQTKRSSKRRRIASWVASTTQCAQTTRRWKM